MSASIKSKDKLKAEKERSIEIACKRYSERALIVLANALDENKTPALEYRWRIAAAKEILDRAWGRPKQNMEANIKLEGADSLLEAIAAGKARAVTKVVEEQESLH